MARVLLIVPRQSISAYWELCFEEVRRQGKITSALVPWQPHIHWLEALKALGHWTQLFTYTDSRMDNAGTRAGLAQKAPFLKPLLKTSQASWIFQQMAQRPWDTPYRTQALRKTLAETNPEFLFISGGPRLAVYPPDFWRGLRDAHPQSRWVLFHGMDPLAIATASEKALLPYLDWVVTNDTAHAKNWETLGARRAIALPISAIAPQQVLDREPTPEEQRRYASTIAFVGTVEPASLYADRVAFLEAVADLGLGFWGPRPSILETHAKLAACYRGEAQPAEVVSIYHCALMGLNIHGRYMPEGANLRTFEIPAAGVLQLLDHSLPGIFSAEEVATYQTPNELREKVIYFKSHSEERAHMARKAHEAVRQRHTFRHRFEKLFELLKTEK